MPYPQTLKFNKFYQGVLVLALLLITIPTTYYVFKLGLSKELIQQNILIEILIFFFLIVIFNCFYSSPKVIIYKDRFLTVRFLGILKKEYYFDELDGWAKRIVEHKYGDYYNLYFIRNNKAIETIASSYYDDLSLLESIVSRTNKRDQRWEKAKENDVNRKSALGFMLVGIIILALPLIWVNNKPYIREQLLLINGTLSEEIEIKKGSKGSRSIIIKLNEYPNNIFRINNLAYNVTYDDRLLENCNIQDSLFLYTESLIDKKTDKVNIDFESTDILELKDKNFCYLSLNDYNKVHTSNENWGTGICIFFGVFLTFIGALGTYKLNKQLKDSV